MIVVPDFLFWLGFGLLLVVAAVLVRRAIRNLRREGASSVLPAVGAAAIVVVVIFARLHTYDAVVVVDGDKGPQAERMLTIGEPDHDPDWIYARHPTWIINRSSRSVYLELVLYGQQVFADPTEIKPGAVGVDERVDYLGPDDRPPQNAKTGTAVLWLRWSH